MSYLELLKSVWNTNGCSSVEEEHRVVHLFLFEERPLRRRCWVGRSPPLTPSLRRPSGSVPL